MYSKSQLGYIRNQERKHLKELLLKENKDRKTFESEDILYTSDFTIKPFVTKKIGDSGNLLLAVNKKDKNEKYVLKHEHFDSACNEYMGYKMANKMGINVALVKLFVIDDKFSMFKSDFVCGIKYLENSEHIGRTYFNDYKEEIINWEDFYKYFGLEALFFEGDGIEILKSGDYIYRIDMTDSFTLTENMYHNLGYDFVRDGINIHESMCKIILKQAKLNDFQVKSWYSYKDFFVRDFGKENLDYYLDPFKKIMEITDEDLKEWVDVLTYFYPKVIGDYFEALLGELKEKVKQFLSDVEELV